MIFNWFRKKILEENKEIIKIVNENGENIEIEKQKWVDEFLKVNLEKNKYDNEKVYNLILVALNYDVYSEIIPYSLLLIKNENYSKRSIDALISIYYNTNSYSDIIAFGDSIIHKDEIEKSSRFYYNYAKSFKKLEYEEEYEKNIFLGISKFPNNNMLIEEFLKILNSREKKERDEIIEAFKDVEFSYKLNLIFSKMKYEEKEYELANELIKNTLIYSKYNIAVVKEVTNILFKYNQYIEFENTVIAKFDIRDKNYEYIDLILDYYEKMFKFEEGLKLLNDMNYYNLINEENINKYLKYETFFLEEKFRQLDREKYESVYNEKVIGNYSYINITHPLAYYFLSKNENLLKEKNDENNRLFLPIAINDDLKEIDFSTKIFLNLIPLFLLEKTYYYTENKLTLLYKKDEVYIKNTYGNYSFNFLRNVAKSNPSLKEIITGLLFKDENNEKYIQLYTYDCIQDKVYKLVNTIYLENNKAFSINKILNTFIEKYDISMNKIEITNEEIENLKNEFKIFFNYDKNNKNRKLFFLNQLNEYLKLPIKEENLINSLSMINLMKNSKIDVDRKYMNKIYEENLKLNANKKINNLIEIVFGVGNNV